MLTTAQTFFLLEWFLKRYFYADFFKDTRPAAVLGAVRHSLLGTTLVAMERLGGAAWSLCGSSPSISAIPQRDATNLQTLALLVMVIGGSSGLFIFWLVGSDLWKWVAAHETATEQVEMGNYEVHIQEQRPR